MSVRWLGFLGTALVVTAYVPQISHLVKARCAGGLSLWAQLVWTLSAALLFTYAATTGDPVFIALQAYQLVAMGTIAVVSIRHRGGTCATHCGAPADHDRFGPAPPVRSLRTFRYPTPPGVGYSHDDNDPSEPS